MKKKPSAALAFATNVQKLMDHHQISQAELGRKAGVGQSTLSRLLDLDAPTGINPRASTVESIAAHFKIAPWLLLVPNLPLELLESNLLGSLVENYRDASEEGRRAIVRVAENELRYATTTVRKTGS